MKTETLWLVSNEESYGEYHDVVSAVNAEDAARRYVAAIKEDEIEAIEYGKKRYAELVAEGRNMADTYENSGFQISYTLPQEIYAVPQNVGNFHLRNICADREYQAEAFNQLWDWDKTKKVRL